jgi:hypothetical protein
LGDQFLKDAHTFQKLTVDADQLAPQRQTRLWDEPTLREASQQEP